MAQIRINTSQNVQIEHPTANVGIRILSQILDYVFIFVYVMIIVFLVSLIKIDGGYGMLILLLPALFYSFITESIFHGQSFAKMILNIKVVKLDGSQATLLNYFIRWMFRLVDVALTNGVVAVLVVAISSKGQRLGDKAAGTTVVSLKKRHDFKNSIYRKISDNYKMQFSQIELLKEEDISTVNEVLNHYFKNPSVQSRQLLIKTKEAILKKTGIETKLDSVEFLRIIVKDFNYMVRNDEY